MNSRLWYSACYKFVASLDIMVNPLDPALDLCSQCGKNTPFSICMDGCVIPCDKRKLCEGLLKEEHPHGDEEQCCRNHALEAPDGPEEEAESLGKYPMDHSLPLSINARNFQQHLNDHQGNELHWATKTPFRAVQRTVMCKLGQFGISHSKKNPNIPLTACDMHTLSLPPSPVPLFLCTDSDTYTFLPSPLALFLCSAAAVSPSVPMAFPLHTLPLTPFSLHIHSLPFSPPLFPWHLHAPFLTLPHS